MNTHKWNIEESEWGLRICKCEHEKHRACEYVEYLPVSLLDEVLRRQQSILDNEPINGTYEHTLTCNADRRKPIGSYGCSCGIGKKIRRLQFALKRLQPTIDGIAKLFVNSYK